MENYSFDDIINIIRKKEGPVKTICCFLIGMLLSGKGSSYFFRRKERKVATILKQLIEDSALGPAIDIYTNGYMWKKDNYKIIAWPDKTVSIHQSRDYDCLLLFDNYKLFNTKTDLTIYNAFINSAWKELESAEESYHF